MIYVSDNALKKADNFGCGGVILNLHRSPNAWTTSAA
jgi:hypothetical protein